MAGFTPMMQQYREIKEQNRDSILFYRLGDFYEMFFDDARVASKELELVLTGRDCGQEERAPMCGVPYHSAEGYIARLIQKGYKVSICEQMEDPALAKGLVKRDIVRTITPGTVIESSMLEEGRNNFIACAYLDSLGGGVCFCDMSTGQMTAVALEGEGAKDSLKNEAARFSPSEIILSDSLYSDKGLTAALGAGNRHIEHGGEWRFREGNAREMLAKQLADGLPPNLERGIVMAAGGLLSYLHETQKNDLSHIRTLEVYSGSQYMQLDTTARKNLEITASLSTGQKKGSLLWVLDHTKTSACARKLRQWLEKPLLSVPAITERQRALACLLANSEVMGELRELLSGIQDVERIIARIVYGTAGGKELVSLAGVCMRLPRLDELLSALDAPYFAALRKKLDCLSDIQGLVEEAIAPQPPFSVREGGIIREGWNADVDSLRELLSGGTGRLTAIETRERALTGIKNLKVGYNKVFGYYIEVSRGNIDLVPDSYIRKQTLTNCERYITQELKELEGEVLSASDRLCALEYTLFQQLRERVAAEVLRVQQTADVLSTVDVLCSLAFVAEKNAYVMPEVDISDVIDIKEGRHPVVERMLDGAYFVPNDAYLDCEGNRAYIITGPNMAGKSTYMRQVALIAIMAQCGSFVPAESARIGICDRVFTRIGASDDLSSGRSTFMVEMNEVSDILKNATKRSLLILDEIGRGTSTFDGMAIARAVLEYVAGKKTLGAKTLFATHYHELCDMEGEVEGIKNYNIVVKKRGDEIVFIKKIVRGATGDSYGIEVAKLAGLPQGVVKRAYQVLKTIEDKGALPPASNALQEDDGQVSLGSLTGNELTERLKRIDYNTLTPIEALSVLCELVNIAKEC